MQIKSLYQTKITCSKYDANIDSTDTVVTVKLIDFNDAPVKNKSVTLTVDKGYFNKNGSTPISGTTTKSITASTNTNGEITATYTASEWGLATFSANQSNIQVNITGWKHIQRNESYDCYINESSVWLGIHGQHINDYNPYEQKIVSMSFTAISSYLPHGNIWMPVADGRIAGRFTGTQLLLKNTTPSSPTVTISGSFFYPRQI